MSKLHKKARIRNVDFDIETRDKTAMIEEVACACQIGKNHPEDYKEYLKRNKKK